ncbi:MAG: hypothetical protein Ta2A_20000 [Treponemataceae bacterium]|nr:MAG: hypothetical protein Ta2A_20000 [Treponemataceae bacterium]
MLIISLLQAAAPAQGSPQSTLMFFAPLIAIFFIMYFLMIRPQNKKQKEVERMIAGLKKGDKVVTVGGIHGTVSSTREKTVIVKVDDDAKLEFNRTAIASVIADEKKSDAKSEKIEKTETDDDDKKSSDKQSADKKSATSDIFAANGKKSKK